MRRRTTIAGRLVAAVLIAVLWAAGPQAAAAQSQEVPFRPPAVPLVAHEDARP